MRVWRRVFENGRRGSWDGRRRSEQRQNEKNVVEDTFCVFVPPSSCFLFIARFKLCCCTCPHLFCSSREPALSLSTFLSIFCEFKFTSSELVSNQNQLNPWTILSLFAVNSDTPPVRLPSYEKPQEALRHRTATSPVPDSQPQRRPQDAEPVETQLDPLAITCGLELFLFFLEEGGTLLCGNTYCITSCCLVCALWHFLLLLNYSITLFLPIIYTSCKVKSIAYLLYSNTHSYRSLVFIFHILAVCQVL